MQVRKYDLPESKDVKFFKDASSFATKAQDHFLSDREPWGRLLGARRVRRMRNALAQKNQSMLQELYDHVVPLLDEGIQFSIGAPVYVQTSSRATLTKSGRTYDLDGYVFLSEQGIKIVVHGGVLRTAYFCSKTQNDSYHTLFRQAWKSIRVRMVGTRYIDPKGGKSIEHKRVTFVSHENWEFCPNPHDQAKRLKTPPSAWQEWLDEVDEIVQHQFNKQEQ